MTTVEEILGALREAIAGVEAAEDGAPIAVLVAVSYETPDGKIVVSGQALGLESGILTAEHAIAEVISEAIEADDDPCMHGRPN